MATRLFKNCKDVHEPFSNYSHCVEIENPSKFLFCSGQIPATKEGTVLSASDFDAQRQLVFENVKSVLGNSGAQLSDIVRLVTYLCREEDVPRVRKLLSDYFPDNPPANSVCLVKGLTHPDILIEVEATAVL